MWKTDKGKKESFEEWSALKKKYPKYHKREMIELVRKKSKKLQDEPGCGELCVRRLDIGNILVNARS